MNITCVGIIRAFKIVKVGPHSSVKLQTNAVLDEVFFAYVLRLRLGIHMVHIVNPKTDQSNPQRVTALC